MDSKYYPLNDVHLTSNSKSNFEREILAVGNKYYSLSSVQVVPNSNHNPEKEILSTNLSDHTTVIGSTGSNNMVINFNPPSSSSGTAMTNSNNSYFGTINGSSTSTITISSTPFSSAKINPLTGVYEWTLKPTINGSWGIESYEISKDSKRPEEESWSGNLDSESTSIKAIDVFANKDQIQLGVVDAEGKAILMNMDSTEVSQLISLLQIALIKSDGWREYYKSLEGKENISSIKDNDLVVDQEVY